MAADRRSSVRLAVWLLFAVWLGTVALLLGSFRRGQGADAGLLMLALAFAGGAGLLIAGVVHALATPAALGSGLFSFILSVAWTVRDMRWANGAGRHDGQAGLLWFDPALAPLAFGVSLAGTLILRQLTSNAKSRRAQ
jgi:hypothetical protein